MLPTSPLPPLRLSAARSGRVDAAVTLSTVARLVASGAAVSKADLVPAAGLARTTVSAAVDELLARGVLRIDGTRPTAGRGRPADRLALSPGGGHVLLADVGARGAHLAVVDLSQRMLAREHVDLDMRDGPDAVLRTVETRLTPCGTTVPARVPVRAVVIGLPGPVDGTLGIPGAAADHARLARLPGGRARLPRRSTAPPCWRTTSTCARSARPGPCPPTRSRCSSSRSARASAAGW